MVEEKFFGIHQSPDEIAEVLLIGRCFRDRLPVGVCQFLVQVCQSRLQFAVRRFTRERGQVQFLDSFLKWLIAFRQISGTSG